MGLFGLGKKKEIVIDFLYLDLSVCERCQGTENSLEEAIREVSDVLKTEGFEIVVHKVNIVNRELAEQYRFVSSPTIRINGKDIDIEVKESSCQECGDLCGDEVECRVWSYEGQEYVQPPKEYVVNEILKAVHSEKNGSREEAKVEAAYQLPENLEKFFAGQEKKC